VAGIERQPYISRSAGNGALPADQMIACTGKGQLNHSETEERHRLRPSSHAICRPYTI
jgi:hypothetical protein